MSTVQVRMEQSDTFDDVCLQYESLFNNWENSVGGSQLCIEIGFELSFRTNKTNCHVAVQFVLFIIFDLRFILSFNFSHFLHLTRKLTIDINVE